MSLDPSSTGTLELPDCPKSGTGVHNWLWKAAWKCRESDVPMSEAIRILTEGMSRPPTNGDEVVVTVANVYAADPDKLSAKEKWPLRNTVKRQQVCASGFTLADLGAASPVKAPVAAAVIRALFRGHELLCCGWEERRFDTRPLDMWDKLETMRYIVPSPMSAVWGKTKAGHPSKHSLENTGPRRFLICEFDTGTLDEHAALARELSTAAPLVLCVHSGGKSLHSWFNVDGWEEVKTRTFFNYAVSLGADNKLWLRSQFTRMPGGRHASGAVQTIHYFNPKFAYES
jgi:hypothetical protein